MMTERQWDQINGQLTSFLESSTASARVAHNPYQLDMEARRIGLMIEIKKLRALDNIDRHIHVITSEILADDEESEDED